MFKSIYKEVFCLGMDVPPEEFAVSLCEASVFVCLALGLVYGLCKAVTL